MIPIPTLPSDSYYKFLTFLGLILIVMDIYVKYKEVKSSEEDYKKATFSVDNRYRDLFMKNTELARDNPSNNFGHVFPVQATTVFTAREISESDWEYLISSLAM